MLRFFSLHKQKLNPSWTCISNYFKKRKSNLSALFFRCRKPWSCNLLTLTWKGMLGLCHALHIEGLTAAVSTIMIFSLEQNKNPLLLPTCSTKISLLEAPLFQSTSLFHAASELKTRLEHLKPLAQHHHYPCLCSPGNPEVPGAVLHPASLRSPIPQI